MSDRPVTEENVERVREGHGANCSSIGSVIDTLFATATVGAAVFAAIAAALRSEPIRVAGGPAVAAGGPAIEPAIEEEKPAPEPPREGA